MMRRSPYRWTIPTLLVLQLGLLYIQGAQLHRQSQVLEEMHSDLQAIAETLDSLQAEGDWETDDAQTVPAGQRFQRLSSNRMAVLGIQEDHDPAAKELQGSRESAEKAVREARDTQSKLSLQENARKADEAAKMQQATQSWQHWAWAALGVVAVALAARSLLRRRG